MDNVKEIFTDEITLPQNNMREHIDRDELFELSADIKKNGLISPITVRPLNGKYELVAGQRRYLAHQIAGILRIKCIVRELTDDEALAVMTSENLSRVDVNPIDESKHVSRLLLANNSDIKKVASLTGRSETWVRDRLAIAEMPDYMQEMLGKKELKIGVALILNQITDEGVKKVWTYQAVRDGANIALAEYWLQDFKRRLLPGGELAPTFDGQKNDLPPQAVMFECAIDGENYDVRMLKSILIYEGNLPLFNAFVSSFRSAPTETELAPGND